MKPQPLTKEKIVTELGIFSNKGACYLKDVAAAVAWFRIQIRNCEFDDKAPNFRVFVLEELRKAFAGIEADVSGSVPSGQRVVEAREEK